MPFNRSCVQIAILVLFLIVTLNSVVIAKEMKLYQVSSGVLKFDKGWLTAMKDVGKILEFPVAMYIIDHPRGLVVYDTGMNVAVSDGKCDSYWGTGLCSAFLPIQRRDDVIDKWLEKFGT